MAKRTFSQMVNHSTHSHLYTVDDVRRVNDMRVRCCKSSHGVEQSKCLFMKSYTVEELNHAWKVSKK